VKKDADIPTSNQPFSAQRPEFSYGVLRVFFKHSLLKDDFPAAEPPQRRNLPKALSATTAIFIAIAGKTIVFEQILACFLLFNLQVADLREFLSFSEIFVVQGAVKPIGFLAGRIKCYLGSNTENTSVCLR
jgi:hypothetical protein